MQSAIDKTYLPFTSDELRPHFINDVDGHLSYFQKSAKRYHEFLENNPELAGISISTARTPRQIEKDERFWTVTAMKQIFDDPSRSDILENLLSSSYGLIPPVDGISTWRECVDGDLRLYFEVCIPSPPSYVEWLRANLDKRQLIPYILDAAKRTNLRTLEGATHVDAIFYNATNGFSWFIEAKVLSDISYSVSFDNYRNQIARNIDVMSDVACRTIEGLENRKPERSLFGLLTPAQFKLMPESRLYGWLMSEYAANPDALARDLIHRKDLHWHELASRIGWLTFEQIETARPQACPWLLRAEISRGE